MKCAKKPTELFFKVCCKTCPQKILQNMPLKEIYMLKHLDKKQLFRNFKSMLLTLFLLGGPFGPKRPKTVWHFHSFMARVTKIHDFVYFSICLVPMKLFLKKELWNFEKLKKKNLPFRHQRVPPLEKKSKKLKIFVFFQKIILFLLESEFYMFLAFFWGI